MAKTLSDIRGVVRSYLDETTAADWTNAELNTQINAAYHRVYSAVLDVFEDYTPVTNSQSSLVANQQEYSLPTDFLKIRRVEIQYDSASTAIPLRALPINIDSVRRDLGNDNVGVNVLRNPVYYLRANNIGFIPVPSMAVTNGLTIWYYPLQSDLSADTTAITLPYPDRDFILIAWAAAAEALRFGQQESAEADKFDRKVERGILEMQERLEDRVTEESKTIIDTSGDSVDFGEWGY